jgi:transcriptional regulator with XRE-family HTH domain
VKKELREELAAELYANKITTTHVAKILGVSRGQASRILNGRSDTSFENWEKIAALCGKVFYLKDK